MITPGDLITLGICLGMVILFRQMDKGNRSLEKVKKFTDKLKDELDAYIKDRTLKLEESSIALDVQQTKAVAAVKRLETIREDLAKREADLLEKTKSVDEFGKKIEKYDATIKQLLEMTSLAEQNLAKISAESDFADSLGKKVLASKRQLEEIASVIPSLEARFAEENRSQLASIHADTVQNLSMTIAKLEGRVEAVSTEGASLLEQGAAKLKELYQRSYTEAAKRADALEDQAFIKLKEQASERLARYKEQVEEKTSALHEQTKERLLEVQQLAKKFKADWQGEASEYLESVRSEIRSLTAEQEMAVSRIEEKARAADNLIDARAEELKAELHRLETDLENTARSVESKYASGLKALDASIAEKIRATASSADSSLASVLERIDAYRFDADQKLAGLEGFISDARRLDEQLRKALAETENRVNASFGDYEAEQQKKQEQFAEKIAQSATALSERMQALENGLAELKSRAYENVSSKLKVFEDEFFADLAQRSDAITSALDGWTENVNNRLETLSADSESVRKQLEDTYSADLKARLAEIGEQYRLHTEKLEGNIAAVESHLRAKITESDRSILAFVEQFRADFDEAKKSAEQYAKNELQSHHIGLQEMLRNQERELDDRMREYSTVVENAKLDAETVLTGLKGDFTAWQARNAQQFSAAEQLLEDKIASLGSSADSSIAELEEGYKSTYRSFIAKTEGEQESVRQALIQISSGIEKTRGELDAKIQASLTQFQKSYEEMSLATGKSIKDASREADETVRSIKASVQDIRESLDQTRLKLMQKLEAETGTLAQTVEEIDKKQKAFVAQTRVFDRAEELRGALETGIENLKGELSRLDVYRDTMTGLEQQYQKVRKMEEESSQKITRFLTEKKRIDILENDFAKLLSLSDSIDKKLAEFTGTNDDLQQFQIQIRRFEESIGEVNGRYERLEKKAVVLDQTVNGIDKAFENLKDLELGLQSYREKMASIPQELSDIRTHLSELLEHRDKTSFMTEKLATLDEILGDVEKRTEKMQTAREWLARTETRLEEISRQSQDQLKLLGDLLKDDAPAKKAKGAPSPGIRENVVKLAHQGWKVDEIARALQLSRGEVELILELPQR